MTKKNVNGFFFIKEKLCLSYVFYHKLNKSQCHVADFQTFESEKTYKCRNTVNNGQIFCL